MAADLPIMLNVGFQNTVMTSHVVAVLDYQVPSVKRMVKSAAEERPRSVVNLTRGRRALSVVVLTGDRYVVSAIARRQLDRRLGFTFGEKDE